VVDAIEGAPADALEVLGGTHVAVHELDAVGDVGNQLERPGRGQIVDDDHLMAIGDQRPNQIGSDEARPAGDYNAHRAPLSMKT
jgi:hypothetical protein